MMLKGIDPLLSPELLLALGMMGHGDELAVVDRNYPAASTGQRVVRLDGADVIDGLRAILTVFPVDTFVDPPMYRMAPVDDPASLPDVQKEAQRLVEEAEGRTVGMGGLERTAFYDRCRSAFAVVTTTEARPYGCFLLAKGVV
jgi:L-fucose mutarotase